MEEGMTVETFNANFTVKVVKYNPSDNIITIGYNVICLKNETARYFETTVPGTSSDPSGDSWVAIKPEVKAWATSILSVPLRASFVPSRI